VSPIRLASTFLSLAAAGRSAIVNLHAAPKSNHHNPAVAAVPGLAYSLTINKRSPCIQTPSGDSTIFAQCSQTGIGNKGFPTLNVPRIKGGERYLYWHEAASLIF
jgi:hypothetical protein